MGCILTNDSLCDVNFGAWNSDSSACDGERQGAAGLLFTHTSIDQLQTYIARGLGGR